MGGNTQLCRGSGLTRGAAPVEPMAPGDGFGCKSSSHDLLAPSQQDPGQLSIEEHPANQQLTTMDQQHDIEQESTGSPTESLTMQEDHRSCCNRIGGCAACCCSCGVVHWEGDWCLTTKLDFYCCTTCHNSGPIEKTKSAVLLCTCWGCCGLWGKWAQKVHYLYRQDSFDGCELIP